MKRLKAMVKWGRFVAGHTAKTVIVSKTKMDVKASSAEFKSLMVIIHRCRSRHVFRGAKDFCPNFSNLARKIFGGKRSSRDFGHHFFQIKARWAPFLPVFWGSLPRFSEVLRRFSKILPRFLRICPYFQVFCPDFHQIKTFGGALAPLHPRLLHHCNHRHHISAIKTW